MLPWWTVAQPWEGPAKEKPRHIYVDADRIIYCIPDYNRSRVRFSDARLIASGVGTDNHKKHDPKQPACQQPGNNGTNPAHQCPANQRMTTIPLRFNWSQAIVPHEKAINTSKIIAAIKEFLASALKLFDSVHRHVTWWKSVFRLWPHPVEMMQWPSS